MIDFKEISVSVQADADDNPVATFGLYLPGIRPAEEFQVRVRIIHKEDRFTPDIPPRDVFLEWVQDHPLDLWQITVNLNENLKEPPVSPVGSHFGQAGRYLYRYQLLKAGQVVVEWFTDPFALATDVGELGAFDFPDLSHSFAWDDKDFKVPEINDLVVYELQVEEFNTTFEGVIERIAYLKSLGVNTLELMPVTSLKLDFDWGYGPLHYFAPNERCGGVQGLKRLVNACHLNGIAVILDVVYQHVAPEFAYKQIYQATGKESPMIGQDGDYGQKPILINPSRWTISWRPIGIGYENTTLMASATIM